MGPSQARRQYRHHHVGGHHAHTTHHLIASGGYLSQNHRRQRQLVIKSSHSVQRCTIPTARRSNSGISCQGRPRVPHLDITKGKDRTYHSPAWWTGCTTLGGRISCDRGVWYGPWASHPWGPPPSYQDWARSSVILYSPTRGRKTPGGADVTGCRALS